MFRYVVLGLMFILFCGCGTPQEQDDTYPLRPIRVIVPFNPGGETDTFARIIEKGVEKAELDVTLVVVNKPGAAATVGSRYVKDAEPDGYTVLLLHDAMFTAQRAQQVQYGANAFEPVAGTGETGSFLVVHEDSRFNNLKDLTKEITESPGTVVFGVNVAAVSHFGGLQFERAVAPELAKRKSLFRYTQSGSGQDRFRELLGGHIDLTLFSTGEFIRYHKEGIRALAALSEKRDPDFPKVPTAKEQGFPVVMRNMQYWWFPRGTPPDRTDRFSDILAKAMKTDHVKQRLRELNCDPVVVRGEELHIRIDRKVKEFKDVTYRPLFPLPNIPVYLLVATVLLGVAYCFSAWNKRARQGEDIPKGSGTERDEPNRMQIGLALLVLTLTVGYVLSLQFSWLPFRYSTLIFSLVTGVVLSPFRLRALPVVVGIALVLSFGLDYVIHHVVNVDLQ